MSDVMLLGVLRMPIDLWNDSALNKNQRHSRYIEAAERIEALTERVAELERTTQNCKAAVVIAQEWIAEKDVKIAELQALTGEQQ